MEPKYPILFKEAARIAQEIGWNQMQGRISHDEAMQRLAVMNANYRYAMEAIDEYRQLIPLAS